MINKAVIMARGLGTRMRAEKGGVQLDDKQSELASRGIKTLIPIVGEKTLLDFIFDSLDGAGITQFCLVIGREHQAIRDYCGKLNYNISFAIQEKPLGTANAVLAAEEFVKEELFLVLNSDNLYPVNALRELRRLEQPGLIAFDKQSLINHGNISPEKINKFAVIDVDEKGFLTGIVEKPERTGQTALISMNAWGFSPKIFEACRKIELSLRGEYELADAVNFSLRNLGESYRAVFSKEGVLDLSSRDDIESLAQLLMRNG